MLAFQLDGASIIPNEASIKCFPFARKGVEKNTSKAIGTTAHVFRVHITV